MIAIATACGGGDGGTSPTPAAPVPAPTPPTISSQPQPQTVSAPATATFSVTANGTPPLAYQWNRNGVAVAGATASSYTTPPTSRADSGAQFAVSVTNSAGQASSTPALLTVTTPATPPVITAQPQPQTVLAPAAATFSVSATGSAPLAYQWYRDGSPLNGATTASYTTPATTGADNGAQYVVRVTNSAGTTTSNAAALTVRIAAAVVTLDYSREILGAARTLGLAAPVTLSATRTAVVTGADSRAPSTPFTFNWGDGSQTTGFFSQTHVYADATRNYVVRVTAQYTAADADSVDAVVRFVPPVVTAKPFPSAATVTIPSVVPTLASRQPGYQPPSGLRSFDDSYFGPLLPRSAVEYVLSQAAAVMIGVLDQDVERVDGGWRQVILRDPTFGGAYSLWYTTPIAFGAAGAFFQGVPGYSSLLHEMGHNLSLNAPAAFRYGGRIDGNANAIFSEAIAQLFQHSIAYELVNNASVYGLPSDLAAEIASSAQASARMVRSAYDAFLVQGRPFATWNDPATSNDETYGTFMTVARQFMLHAEQSKAYIVPLTRTMRLLRSFNATLATNYAPTQNTAAASAFRATLMVAALSYGFQQDLRSEFRALNFPIDDAAFVSLTSAMP